MWWGVDVSPAVRADAAELQFRHDEEARAGPTGQGITIGGPNNSLARFQPRPNDARNLAAATQACYPPRTLLFLTSKTLAVALLAECAASMSPHP